MQPTSWSSPARYRAFDSGAFDAETRETPDPFGTSYDEMAFISGLY